MANKRGTIRERQVRNLLEAEDYWVGRITVGEADLVALKPNRCLLVQVKSTVTAWSHFGPADRERLKRAARLAGAEAWLAWWPKGGELRWYASQEWPRAPSAFAGMKWEN